VAKDERFLCFRLEKSNAPRKRRRIHTGVIHMSTYTVRQLRKLMELVPEETTVEQFQAVLASGLVSDIFNPNAKLTQRLAIRQALGLGPLLSIPGQHVVEYSLTFDQMVNAGNYDWKCFRYTHMAD